MRRNGNTKKMMYFCAIMILVLGMLFSGLRILESTVFYRGVEAPTEIRSKTIVRDGIEYFPRQDITVIMALGIDQTGPVVSSGSYRNPGAADAIVLLILDEKSEEYAILCLNRDMMVTMPVLGIGGKQAGTYYGQLALSHTYGDGLEDSCVNTRQTISDTLHGILIDHYLALNMNAISIVNDAVGGVTVQVTDDFSKVDTSLPVGQVTLHGEQALNFVRSRKDVGNQLNVSRMQRHEEYMNGLMDALTAKIQKEDLFMIELYDQVADYMVTDCSANFISGLMERCSHYTLKEIVSIEGENVMGDKYYEFYADAEKLDALILRLFYAPKA